MNTASAPWPLTPDELLFRQAYLEASEKRFWTEPMPFSQYKENLDAGLLVNTPNSSNYYSKSIGGLGVTMDDVQNIAVVLHSRYSYPVLHNHLFLELVYVQRGECVNFLDRSALHMKQGDISILAPSVLHAISCTSDEDCILNILVSRSFFERYFLKLLQGGKVLLDFFEGVLYHSSVSPYLLYETGGDPWIEELSAHICSEVRHQGHAYQTSVYFLTGELLLHLARTYEFSAIVPDPKNNAPTDRIAAIMGYINANFRQATLGDTAEAFGYSPAYMSRLIREHTGKSFTDIVTQMQMERAAELMEQGKQTLLEIAHEVGCFDSSHFIKKFKRVYGVSPKQFLQKAQTSNPLSPAPSDPDQ